MVQESNFVRAADGTSLFVRSYGAGIPLVFLSGWTLSSRMWDYQVAPLSEQGFRCIAIDRRGHGRSGDPGRGYDFDTLADDVEAVLQSHEVYGATLVSHSVAAGELVRHVTRHGSSRVVRLAILSSAATPYLRKTADNPGGLDAALIASTRAEFSRSFPDWAEANAEPYFTPDTSRALRDWTINMMLETSLVAARGLNHSQTSTDFRPELAAIKLPSLVIHGDRDASAPLELTGRPTAQAIPGARLSVYEGGPHGMYFTHQERLNRELAAFAREAG
jgi:non-heme chloroperoxidase